MGRQNCKSTFNSRVVLFVWALLSIVSTLYLLVAVRFQNWPLQGLDSPVDRATVALAILIFVSLVTKALYLPNFLKRHLSGAPYGSAWDRLDDAIKKYFKLINMTIIFAGISLLTIDIVWIGYASLYAAWITATIAVFICVSVIVKLIKLKRRLTAAPALFFRRS